MTLKTRPPRLWRALALVACALAACASLARAQDGQPAAPATPAAPAAEAPTKSEMIPAVGVPDEKPGAVGGAVPSATLPTTAPASPKVQAILKGKELSEIVKRLSDQTGLSIRLMGKLGPEKMDLVARDEPLEDVLTKITKASNWVWVKRDDAYEIYTQDDYKMMVLGGDVIRRSFKLKYIEAEQFVSVVEKIITPDIGAIAFDPRINTVIVTDLPDKVQLIEGIINEYDIQLYSRVFQIQHADTKEIADRLNEIKSSTAEIQIDEKNRIIIVKDTFERIKEMESLVQLLDRDQEIRVYNLANIGVDSKLANDLITDVITPLLTTDALIKYNETTSRLLVRDVRTVHEKIAEIIAHLDQPRKQALIEGEVLSVKTDVNSNIGTEFTYSDNLYGAYDTGKLDNSFGGAIDQAAGVNTLGVGLPLVSTGAAGLNIIELNKHYRLQLTALLSNSTTNLLLRPELIIANHEKGEFKVTKNDPVLQTFFSSSTGTTGDSRSEGQRLIESGLQVEITPHISNRGLIETEVNFINSDSFERPLGGADNQIGIGTTEESANTILLIPSGETRVIGGLIQHNTEDGTAGVPILSNIPYLGALFGSKTKKDSKRNLMFFLTATIIQEEPLNGILVEPVNEAARISMSEEQATPGKKEVNVIPEELKPYLKEIQPEAWSMDKIPAYTDEATTGTLAARKAAGEVFSDQATSATLKLHSEAGQALLTDAPLPLAPEGGRKAGGAGLSGAQGTLVGGPSGGLGTGRKIENAQGLEGAAGAGQAKPADGSDAEKAGKGTDAEKAGQGTDAEKAASATNAEAKKPGESGTIRPHVGAAETKDDGVDGSAKNDPKETPKPEATPKQADPYQAP